MFVRLKKNKGKTYINLVKTFRENGKVKQKFIASLGCIESSHQKQQLINISRTLSRFLNDNPNLMDISTAEEKSRKIYGPVVCVKKIWNDLGINKILNQIIERRNITFDFLSTVFLMVLDRISSPRSKLSCYNGQERFSLSETTKIDLQHLYRSLDLLAEEKETIEMLLFESQKNLFNLKVDVIFYDVTTYYFESVKEDELKKFGFSKDQKINEVQVVMGLLVDMDGRPIGFDLFPGNTFEGKTVETIIERIEKRFNINRLIFIGDQGILSKDNIEKIESAGYEYVLGGRIKNTSKQIKKKIFETEGYQLIEDLKYKSIPLTDKENLLVGYSERRAAKDKKDRERLIEKAKKIVGRNGEIVSRRGAIKYISFDEKISMKKLNEEKISYDEQWDGYYGIRTNVKSITDEEIFSAYHQLWRIEESFRVLKTHLEARPIFHWTAQRILGHFTMCFIAFLTERTLELKLKTENKSELTEKYSHEKIREALNSLQYSEIEITGQKYYISSKVEGLSNEILRGLNIAIPTKISTTVKSFL